MQNFARKHPFKLREVKSLINQLFSGSSYEKSQTQLLGGVPSFLSAEKIADVYGRVLNSKETKLIEIIQKAETAGPVQAQALLELISYADLGQTEAEPRLKYWPDPIEIVYKKLRSKNSKLQKEYEQKFEERDKKIDKALLVYSDMMKDEIK